MAEREKASRRSAKWLERGRVWARTQNTDDLLAKIASALKPWSGSWVMTHWENVGSTRGGTEKEPGLGAEVEATLTQHADARREIAERIAKKGAADTVAHGTSRYQGSFDEEATSRTGFFLDDDEDAHGDGWERVLELVQALDLAHIVQRRPEAGKYHVEIPLAEPLPLEPGDKLAWSCQLGYVLGVFSEAVFGENNEREFDPRTDRLLQLIHLYTRRKESDPIPETLSGGTLAVSWLDLLVATEFPDDVDEVDDTTIDHEIEPTKVTPELLDRASEYLAKLPSAIEGEGGHDALWRASLALARGFRLPTDIVLEMIEKEFNPRCEPPWSAKEIRHKIEDAAHSGEVREGYLLENQAERAIRNALCHKRESKKDERPVIQITTDEHLVIDEVIEAFKGSEKLFRSNNYLAEVIKPDEEEEVETILRQAGSPYIRQVSQARLQDLICSTCQFEKYHAREDEWLPAHPPAWLVAGVEARGRWPKMNRLVGVGDSPVFLPDGDVPLVAGYHKKSGLYVSNGVNITIPKKLTIDDAVKAQKHVMGILDEFPFCTPAHAAGWFCALLTTLARFAFLGPSPITFIEASQMGSGKSLLVDIISMIAFGRIAARSSYSPDDEEMRKKITTIVRSGDRMILFDNIENGALLKSSALDRAATAESWEDRILGTNISFRGPIYTVFYLSGNNLTIGGDLSRRIVHVRLEPQIERPELVTDWKIPSILSYVKEHRSEILSSIFTALRAYHEAGRPDMGLSGWGSFDAWSALPRSATVYAGLADPGDSREGLAEMADTTRQAGASFVRELYVVMEGRAMTSKEILDACGHTWGAKRATLKSALEECCNAREGQPLTPKLVGNALKRLRGRIFGGLVLVPFDKAHDNVLRWKVVKK